MSALTERQLDLAMLPPIASFDGQFRFLSNFHPAPVALPFAFGATVATGEWPLAMEPWPAHAASVEHAFQAAKAMTMADALWVLDAPSPARAKARGGPHGDPEENGRTIALRADWERVKVTVMVACVRAKFIGDEASERDERGLTDLGRKLVATSPRVLVEGNHWRDDFWGVYRGRGKNMLGRILMLVRSELSIAATCGLHPLDLR